MRLWSKLCMIVIYILWRRHFLAHMQTSRRGRQRSKRTTWLCWDLPWLVVRFHSRPTEAAVSATPWPASGTKSSKRSPSFVLICLFVCRPCTFLLYCWGIHCACVILKFTVFLVFLFQVILQVHHTSGGLQRSGHWCDSGGGARGDTDRKRGGVRGKRSRNLN